MPAIHRYIVTETREVTVMTAEGPQVAMGLAQRALRENAAVSDRPIGTAGSPEFKALNLEVLS